MSPARIRQRLLIWLSSLLLFTHLLAADEYRPLLIVSLDGFRWDYCELYREQTPTLHRLRSQGACAKALIPAFPSNTFPNHYTIVTGLRPSNHGVINNTMFDPGTGENFVFSNARAVRNPRWWGGEPIWVTSQRQGKVAACSFWVGSEALIKGQRPKWVRTYDPRIAFSTRLEELASWFKSGPGQRPDVVTVYLEDANAAGHRGGPDSNEMKDAAAALDRAIADLLAVARESGANPNLVIVSDHGMTELRAERLLPLERILDLTTVQIDFVGPVAGIRPVGETTVEEIMYRLRQLPNGATASLSADLPERLHFVGSPRIPPIVILPAMGGWVGHEKWLEENLQKTRGEHGYDPSHPDMQGVLIVHGPDFQNDGRVVEPTENIHLYNLFCSLLAIQPAPNDGDERLINAFSRSR